jgi:hypothetical protein
MKQVRLFVARIDRIGDVVLSRPVPGEVQCVYPKLFDFVGNGSISAEDVMNRVYSLINSGPA